MIPEPEGYRRQVRDELVAAMDAPGSMLSAEICARFLKVSYRTIYRWRNTPQLYLPNSEICAEVERFARYVKHLRKEWAGIVKHWPKCEFAALDKWTKAVIFPAKILRVLDAGELSNTEKVEQCTVESLKIHAGRMKRKAEKSEQEEEDE